MASLSSDRRGVFVPCPSCRRTNRVPYERLDRATRCGSCHTELPVPAAPVEVPDAPTFDALVASASLPVVVDFWAPWCGPCHMMAPEVERAARQMAGRALVVKVNTEAAPELGERFRIRSIPTLAVFREGRERSRAAGVRPAAAIESLVGGA